MQILYMPTVNTTLAPGIKVATVWVSAGEHEHRSKMSPGSFNKACAILT